MTTWRGKLAPYIGKIIKENEGKSEKEIRKALRKAYPLGQRKYWPYKVWLDEINFQLGKSKKSKKAKKERKQLVVKGQLDMFEGEKNE